MSLCVVPLGMLGGTGHDRLRFWTELDDYAECPEIRKKLAAAVASAGRCRENQSAN